MRVEREWLGEYHENVRNKVTLYLDYNTQDLINHFWECSVIYYKILNHESKFLELGDSVLRKHSNSEFYYFRPKFLE